MAEKSTSASERLRREGNVQFLSAKKDLAPVLQISRFQKALTCYENAYNVAKCDEDLAACAKNIGVTCWKITEIERNQTSTGWLTVKSYFTQAMKYFCHAFKKGETAGKTQVWLDNILMSSRGCWESLNGMSFPEKYKGHHMEAVRELIQYIPSSDIQADCFLDVASHHFHQGLDNINKGNYKQCLVEMKECYYPMNEAQRIGASSERIISEVRILEEDVYMHTCLAESMKSRVTGDQLFDEVLLDEETLNVDMIWEVIDWYKDSILKVRDLDIKEEAISLCRIGLVYDKVLKIKFRAKDYLKKSLELAHSITPFYAGEESWYKDCVAVLQRYQRETVQHEESENDKLKAAAREELKPELDDLKSREDHDYKEFLTHIYKTYPPKNPTHTLNLTKKNDEEGDFAVKYRVLQKAVIHYHPDRVKLEEHGMKAKVLNEEITKYLTKRYEQVKSMK